MIGGPTAAGKSALALALAERIGGEIVGADSRQLYRGMPIASAAPTSEERARVPHHLYESVDLNVTLSAATFLKLADDVVDDIQRRGKVAVVVGGTGLYLRALRLGIDEALPTDPALKQTLEDDLAREGLATLVARLRAVDVDAADSIDRNNPVRVVRALEIALLGGNAGGRSIDALLARPPRDRYAQARFLLVDHAELIERIEERTRAMFAAGVVDEASALSGILPLDHALLRTIGIHEALLVALGVSNVENAIDLAATRTRQYAKRQRTWFKKEPWWKRVKADDVDGAIALIGAAS
ncbi:MAG: tRNA (adenosine(37)-N6)-dimethylallyltransferase MiaA [Deltaproteobacteria bacterium]|nr:tRNA (adenosine(37)-N6)-dimethylallyltransferase MiaA [Deltaproteobacteria bacterium]